MKKMLKWNFFGWAVVFGMGLFSSVSAQPHPNSRDPRELYRQLDSISREVERSLYTVEEKADIRTCGRGKDSLLRVLRAEDGEYLRLNEALTQAKLAGETPENDKVRSLLEAKYTLEAGFNSRFEAGSLGKRCIQGEKARHQKLREALERHGGYRQIKKALAEVETEASAL